MHHGAGIGEVQGLLNIATFHLDMHMPASVFKKEKKHLMFLQELGSRYSLRSM